MSLTAPSNCVRWCVSQRQPPGSRRPCTVLQEEVPEDTVLFLEKCVCPFRDPIPKGNGQWAERVGGTRQCGGAPA